MRIVALLAFLVSARRAGLLGGMASPARESFGRGVREGGSMARSAVLVAGVGRDEGRLARVACRTERLGVLECESVRLVAPFAGHAAGMRTRVERGDIRVAARAGRSEETRVLAMRRVAVDARSLRSVRDVYGRVAPHAGGGRVGRGVGGVAIRADCMRGGNVRHEGRLLPMAANARALAPGDKVVRLMATDARIVTRGARTGRLGMAGRAHGEGGGGRHVGAMAIETSLGTGMLPVLDGALYVAARAISRDDRRRLVDAVALGAVDRRVLRDRRRLSMPLGVAADARGRGSTGSEGVARQAPGGVTADPSSVRDLRLFGVAVLAHAGSGVFEAVVFEIVARGAVDVEAAHVFLVPGARAVLDPRRGDEGGGYARWRARPPLNDCGDRRGKHDDGGRDRPRQATSESRHGPTPWQSRQGKS
jgi:hypothetical protein